MLATRVGAAPPPARNGDGMIGLTADRDGLSSVTLRGEGNAVLDPDAAWHIGSNTKAMTAALYARVAAQGRLALDQPVAELFAGIPADAAWRTITAREVMGHVGGLIDAPIVDLAWLRARHVDRSPPRAQRRALVGRLLAGPPAGTVGTFAYGNLNYVLLGAAIEDALDRDWEAALRTEVFAPLAMTGAAFGPPPPPAPLGRVGSGERMPPHLPQDNPAVLGPAATVHVTPDAYARWLAAWLGGAPDWLPPAALDQLLTPSAPEGTYAGGWLLLGPPEARGAALTHAGSNTMWFAQAAVDRRKGRAAAAFTNRGGSVAEQATGTLMRELMRAE